MASVAIELEGIEDLVSGLKKLADASGDLKAAHAKAGVIVERAAEKIVTVKSGRLKASIRSTGQKGSAAIRAGKKAVPYAAVQHFGWPRRNIRPQLYLYKARDKTEGRWIRVYDDELDRLAKIYL